jgi:hypothetical protein
VWGAESKGPHPSSSQRRSTLCRLTEDHHTSWCLFSLPGVRVMDRPLVDRSHMLSTVALEDPKVRTMYCMLSSTSKSRVATVVSFMVNTVPAEADTYASTSVTNSTP